MTSDAAARTTPQPDEQPAGHATDHATDHAADGRGSATFASGDQPTVPKRIRSLTQSELAGPSNHLTEKLPSELSDELPERLPDHVDPLTAAAGVAVGVGAGVTAGVGRPDEDHAVEHSSERSPVGVGEGVVDSRPSAAMSAAGDLLRALAAPVRIAIVLELREHDRCVHELVQDLGVAQPLISQHLRVLKSAGVVRGERHGREVVYSLVDEHLAHIVVDAVAHVEEGS